MNSRFAKSVVVAVGILVGGQTSEAGTFAGIFGYGIELQATGAGATHTGTTLYALNNGGGTELLPAGSTATLNLSSWLSSPESGAGPTFSLGTFNPTAGDVLVLKGFSMLTFRDANGTPATDVTSSYGNYRVSAVGGALASFPPGVQLTLNESMVGGSANDDRWANEAQSINLLADLAPGTYVLGSYGFASTSDQGNKFANNGGPNYGALFTVVVPEPTSVALLALSGLTLVCRRR